MHLVYYTYHSCLCTFLTYHPYFCNSSVPFPSPLHASHLERSHRCQLLSIEVCQEAN